MCDSLEVTPFMPYVTFFVFVDKLFSEGITWGRIVSLFAFGGALSEHCLRQGHSQLVGDVAEWVALYTKTRLLPWIASNGGWVSICF